MLPEEEEMLLEKICLTWNAACGRRDASGEDLSYLECCLSKKRCFWRRSVLPGVLPEEEEMLLEKICAGTNGQEEPAQHHQHTPGQVEGLGGR